MKHYKELNALRNKISDGRSTRDSIARAAAQYVALFDTKDELAIELNEYKNIHFERSLPTIITDPIAQFGSNLPGDQLVLWDTYNADLPRATFEEYVKEQVKGGRKIMKLYHATDFANLSDILDEGLRPSSGVIYFAESYEKAVAFLAFRNVDIVVFEVEVDIEQCRESFNHSESMFCRLFKFDTCRAWTYDKAIPAEQINFSKMRVYNRKETSK